MAEKIVREVLTKFVGDSTSYVSATDKATKSTVKLDAAQDEQIKNTEKQSMSMQKLGKGLDSVDKLLGNMIPGLRQVNAGFKGAEKAAVTFGKSTKLAIASTGVGALVLVIGSLIAKFSELKDKSADDMTFMESKIFSIGTAITDGIGAAITWVTGLFNDFVGFVAPALKAEMDAYDARQKAQQQQKKEQEGLIAQAETALALSKARGESTQQQIAAERELLNLQLANAKTSEDIVKLAIQKAALDKKEADEKKRLADEAEAKRTAASQAAVAAEQARTQAIYEQQAAREAREKELADTVNRVTKGWEEGTEILNTTIDLTEELTEAEKKLGEEAYKSAKRGVESRKELSDASSELVNISLGAIKEFSANRIVDATAAAAMAILRVWEGPGGVLVKLAQSAVVAFQTAKQINAMKAADSQLKTSFEDGGIIPAHTGGMITGRRHYQGGVKFRVGGHVNEAEGGEYIVNRRATARFLPLLERINKKYADGGVVARTEDQFSMVAETIRKASADARPVLVLETLRRAEANLAVVENLARR